MVLRISTFLTPAENTVGLEKFSILIFNPSKEPNLFDGLLNFLQVDVFGFPQQSILIHFQHRHSVLAQLNHHHIWLHGTDCLIGQTERGQRMGK